MKIQFSIPEPELKLVSTWEEIKKYKAEKFFSKEFYIKIKLLEFNKDFELEIKKSRKKIGIPENGCRYEDNENEIELNHNKKYLKEIDRLCNLFKFDLQIEKCLGGLVWGNWVSFDCFFTDTSSISYYYDDYEDIPDSVVISITRPISKHCLVKFIEDNWDIKNGINDELQKLPSWKKLSISERDLRIIEIKNSNPSMSYPKIAKEIIKEFGVDNLDDEKNNPDSIKTAYFRTKEKIDVLAHRIK